MPSLVDLSSLVGYIGSRVLAPRGRRGIAGRDLFYLAGFALRRESEP